MFSDRFHELTIAAIIFLTPSPVFQATQSISSDSLNLFTVIGALVSNQQAFDVQLYFYFATDHQAF